MTKEELPIGTRCYHGVFGWCKVTHPVNQADKVLVDLEADEIEYYVMGMGYKSYKRDKDIGRNVLLTPIEDLLEDDQATMTNKLALKKVALNPKLTFWDKEHKNEN